MIQDSRSFYGNSKKQSIAGSVMMSQKQIVNQSKYMRKYSKPTTNNTNKFMKASKAAHDTTDAIKGSFKVSFISLNFHIIGQKK